MVREILTCRRVLHLMVNSEFIMNTMLKAVFNIAIVAMVKKKDQPNTSHLFSWSEDQKQEILGIFFWGFALTKIVSGRLAEIIGSRKVSGYSMALASLLTICTPTIAYWNYYVLLMSRVVVGFLIGATWPAVMPLASKWIPPQDHSVFISCLASTAIGAALAYHLHGVLIDAYGWASVFYVTGSMGLLWSLVWFYLVYDSPNQHPRISQREKQTIESEIEVNNAKPKQFNQIPWKQIAKSGPVWAITAGQVATFLGYTTCLNEMPSYLDQVLHLNIKQNGFFSGLPYWGGYCASLGSGYIADWLIKSGKLSTTTVRKIFESVALLIPTMSMLTLALWGDIPLIAFIAFTTSLTTNAISTAGHAANILDISPNYAGTICGIVNTFSAFAVYLSTRLVAMLLRNGQSFQEWRHLFWTLFSTYLSASIIYLIWCSSKVQPWDSEKREENVPHSIDMHLLGKKENA